MYALIQQRETAGTSGGSLSGLTHEIARTLNTVAHDTIGVTLTTAEDGFTVDDDCVIRIRATAPVNVDGHSQLLVRIRDTVEEFVGHSGRQLGDQQTAAPVMNHRDTVTTPPFAVRAGEVVEIVHLIYGTFSSSDALGAAANRGVDEVYTEVEIFAA